MAENTSVICRLYNDLKQSYERNHQNEHIHFAEDGSFIEFEGCSLWVCKNRREKLAEWQHELSAIKAV